MKKFFYTSIILGICLLSFGLAPDVFAGDYGLSDTARSAGLPTEVDLPTLVGNIIGQALALIGVLFFVLMVYGGFLWMTARGNEDQTTKARNTIIAAVIGMLIVFASYALTNFVFEAVQSGGGGAQNEVVLCGSNSEPQCVGEEVGASCVANPDPAPEAPDRCRTQIIDSNGDPLCACQ